MYIVYLWSMKPIKLHWVNCPVCDEPDMRQEWFSDDDGPYIFCTNIACLSNGGESMKEDLRKKDSPPQKQEKLPISGIMGFVRWILGEGWYLHSINRWCKGESWPPDDQCTEKELFEKWFGQQ